MAEAFLYAALATGAVYLALALAFCAGIRRLRPGQSREQPPVTVVVPAHNEAANIGACLAALAAQTYPPERTEVLVVDDRSTDGTPALAGCWVGRVPGLSVHSVKGLRYACPKKNALDLGIRAGRGDIILTTDADCRPPPGWIASTVRCFSPGVGLVAGPAPLTPGPGLLQRLLALQGLAVSALAAGSIGAGFPLTCSGRNLAYRRDAFRDAGGFAPIGHIRGGDDVLLMRRIAAGTAWQVRFNPDPGAAVPSAPHTDSPFRRQVRYQSKAVHYGIPALILALTVYIFHLILAAGPALAWAYPGLRLPLGALAAAKILADGLLLWAASRFGAHRQVRWLPLLEFVSVPYVVLFCALGVLLPARWK